MYDRDKVQNPNRVDRDEGHQRRSLAETSALYAGRQPAGVAGPAEPETAFHHVARLADHATGLSHRVINLAERLLGAVPSATGGAVTQPQAAGLIAAMTETCQGSTGAIAGAMEALDRIERALPR